MRPNDTIEILRKRRSGVAATRDRIIAVEPTDDHLRPLRIVTRRNGDFFTQPNSPALVRDYLHPRRRLELAKLVA